MAIIKIKDLPKDKKISKEEMRRIHAGSFLNYLGDDQVMNMPIPMPMPAPPIGGRYVSDEQILRR